MTPEHFIEKWRKNTRTEKSAAQEHFLDICELLGVEKPASVDPAGDWFTFEKHITIDEARKGFVDVWRKDSFAWEYKRSYDGGEFNHKNLVKAYSQVRGYAPALGNPPILIVSDMKETRIHTNFTNSITETHVFKLPDLNDSKVRQKLLWCFTDPERLRPEITREGVTTKAAMALGHIAQKLRKRYDAQRVAHFLNKIVFCLFAEDIDLLPNEVFADILEECKKNSGDFPGLLGDLFRAMKDKDGRFGMLKIPWFNGGLFDDEDVLPLGFQEITELSDIAFLDWSAIEPAIFGSLFEGGLNPDKRKQMASLFDAYGVNEDKPDALPDILDNPMSDKGVGIHYTAPETIMKIINPVVLEPLRREWGEVKTNILEARDKKDKAKSDGSRTKAENQARKYYEDFRHRLGNYRVLDPACGSGNFLYLTLQHLKDFDLQVLREAEELGLPRHDQCVGPHAMQGLEINPYAAELARVTLWIGELQWQMNNNFGVTRAPILSSLDGIRNQDALINPDGTEAKWPTANAVVGNPPFLGDKKMIAQLGEEYTKSIRALFDGRVPGGADLVTYWFEKARAYIEAEQLERAGLVSTQGIRTGKNRKLLDAIVKIGRIYNAWSDEEWVVDGADVRVSLTCFDGIKETTGLSLNGKQVGEINPDLTSGAVDITKAIPLNENRGASFIGTQKNGPFDVSGEVAREWLKLPKNPNGQPNADVLRPWANGMDITRRPSGKWIIDFGVAMSYEEAALYEAPFKYAVNNIKPKRTGKREDKANIKWWLLQRTRPEMRKSISDLERYIVTPRVAKYRLFAWLPSETLPDTRLVVFAKSDDTSFGILHSHFHEVWSLRKATMHGVGNDPQYTPSDGFETFPFPEGLTPNIQAKDYATKPRAQAIAEAARELNEFRENWLNPPEWVRREPEMVEGYPDRILPINVKAAKELKKRTLTNLYNARPAWLDNAHKKLDTAVAAAYGWPDDLSDDEILEKLFELNQERAAEQENKAEPKKQSSSKIVMDHSVFHWAFKIELEKELTLDRLSAYVDQIEEACKEDFEDVSDVATIKEFTIIAQQGSIEAIIQALIEFPAELLKGTGAASAGLAALVAVVNKTKGGKDLMDTIYAAIEEKVSGKVTSDNKPELRIGDAIEDYTKFKDSRPDPEDHNQLWEKRSFNRDENGLFIRDEAIAKDA